MMKKSETARNLVINYGSARLIRNLTQGHKIDLLKPSSVRKLKIKNVSLNQDLQDINWNKLHWECYLTLPLCTYIAIIDIMLNFIVFIVS